MPFASSTEKKLYMNPFISKNDIATYYERTSHPDIWLPYMFLLHLRPKGSPRP